MKAFVLGGYGKSWFEEREKPRIVNDDDVLVKVLACGICGSDIHFYTGHTKQTDGDIVPGHEFCGVVTEVGAKVSGLRVGDRVVHEPIRYCGQCYACRHGQGNVCRSLQVTGCSKDGGFEEYYAAPEKQWHRMPDDMSALEGAMIEPYTIAAQSCGRAGVAEGDTVLIHGGGPIGLMCADTARKLGARVMLSEIMTGRLAIARANGVDVVINPMECDLMQKVSDWTDGEGVNVVLDCAGLKNMAEKTLEMLSPAGRFVPVANSDFNAPSRLINVKQLQIIGSRLQMGRFREVLDNFDAYRANAARMVTNVFSFEDTQRAFIYAAERHPEAGKILVRFD